MPFTPTNPYVLARHPLPEVPLEPGRAAMLVIDMQQYFGPASDFMDRYRSRGLSLKYYEDRFRLVTMNIARLQAAFRRHGIDVMFATIESILADGRGRGLAHQRAHLFAGRGSRAAEILDELKPTVDEVVFRKSTGSVFASTTLDRVLRSMGVRALVMTGAMTNGCVESTVRDASDLDYEVVLVEDACAAVCQELHEHSLEAMYNLLAVITETDAVIRSLQPATAPDG